MPHRKLDLTDPKQLEEYLGLHDEAAEKKAAATFTSSLNLLMKAAQSSGKEYPALSALLATQSITNTQPKKSSSADEISDKTPSATPKK